MKFPNYVIDAVVVENARVRSRNYAYDPLFVGVRS